MVCDVYYKQIMKNDKVFEGVVVYTMAKLKYFELQI